MGDGQPSPAWRGDRSPSGRRGDEVAGKGPEVDHLGGILRRDDEAEMMPVVEAASREGPWRRCGPRCAALLTVPGDAVALEVGDVGRQRRRVEGPPLMTDPPGLDDDTTFGGEQTAAAERGARKVKKLKRLIGR
jgi:hypothetical protein